MRTHPVARAADGHGQGRGARSLRPLDRRARVAHPCRDREGSRNIRAASSPSAAPATCWHATRTTKGRGPRCAAVCSSRSTPRCPMTLTVVAIASFVRTCMSARTNRIAAGPSRRDAISLPPMLPPNDATRRPRGRRSTVSAAAFDADITVFDPTADRSPRRRADCRAELLTRPRLDRTGAARQWLRGTACRRADVAAGSTGPFGPGRAAQFAPLSVADRGRHRARRLSRSYAI